jgi:hypothetical protein
VPDGIIQFVSAVHCESFSITILWIPSPIKLIALATVSQKAHIGSKVFFNTDLKFVQIPASVEVLDESCFDECRSLSSVSFETGSRLSRIGEWAFRGTGLVEIVVPSPVEVLNMGVLC